MSENSDSKPQSSERTPVRRVFIHHKVTLVAISQPRNQHAGSWELWSGLEHESRRSTAAAEWGRGQRSGHQDYYYYYYYWEYIYTHTHTAHHNFVVSQPTGHSNTSILMWVQRKQVFNYVRTKDCGAYTTYKNVGLRCKEEENKKYTSAFV